MHELPEWQEGTVAVLSTSAGPPHAIPVSTAVRAGPRRALIALGRGRESLARLRRDPQCALTVMAPGDLAFTAHARATVIEEDIEGVAAVALDVDAIQDHMQPRFAIEAGVAWRWTDERARERDAAVRAALVALARR